MLCSCSTQLVHVRIVTVEQMNHNIEPYIRYKEKTPHEMNIKQ